LLQTLTGKIRLLPTDDDVLKLRETRSSYMQGCNLVSKLVFESFCLDKKELHRQTYSRLRSKVGLKSQMAQSVMATVVAR